MNIESQTDIVSRATKNIKDREAYRSYLYNIKIIITLVTTALFIIAILTHRIVDSTIYAGTSHASVTLCFSALFLLAMLVDNYHNELGFFSGNELNPGGAYSALISISLSVFALTSIPRIAPETLQVPYLLALAVVCYVIVQGGYKYSADIDGTVFKYREANNNVFNDETVDDGYKIYGVMKNHLDNSEIMNAFTDLTDSNRFPTNQEAKEIISIIDEIKIQQVVDNESAVAEHSKRATLNQINTKKV
jgi:hypothetical protein